MKSEKLKHFILKNNEQTRDSIINEIYKDSWLYQTCLNICYTQPLNNYEHGSFLTPEFMANELLSEVLFALCQINEEKLIHLYQTNGLRWYLTRICTNQGKSKTSRFYRNVKRRFIKQIDINKFNEIFSNDNSDPIDTLKDEWMDFINQCIHDLHWYDQQLFRIYYIDGMSFEKMSKKIGIPLTSIKDSVYTSRNRIIELVQQEKQKRYTND